jgi:malonate-semialdehyde dehydrogenase (acetylating)/methylmalonate-semialdehyde dehydrogenase
MVGINVGIPVPLGMFGFTGCKNSFFGDLHAMGTDGVQFFTELKNVTSRTGSPKRRRARPRSDYVGWHDYLPNR